MCCSRTDPEARCCALEEMRFVVREAVKVRGGFTLVELLLSTAIFSVIIGAAYAVFVAGLDLQEKADRRLLRLQSARFALARITEDLQSAAIFGTADTFLFEGFDGQGENERDDDAIDFASFSNASRVGDSPASDQCEIGYLIYADPERGTSILYRRLDATVDEDITEGGTYQELAEGVVSLNIEYYDGLSWEESFQSDRQLPERVRVTLGFAERADAPLVEYRAVIRLAHYSESEGAEGEE